MYKEQLISIIQECLGPAARRFVERQIEFHLEKDRSSEIESSELKKFAEAARVELKSVVDDESLVDECYKRMLQLSND